MAVTSPTTPLLQMKGIGKNFPGVRALEGVDFELYPGEVHCLVGENGAGKSTLVKLISGVYQPDAGVVSLFGDEVQIHSPHFAQKLGISTVYQELDLVPILSVAENISLGREIVTPFKLLDIGRIEAETRLLLRDLGVELNPRQLVQDLGITYQQLVAIAKALSRDSRILILDEPTAALSLKEVELLFDTIKRLKQKGIGIVYVSHRLEEILKIGDRVTVLRDGQLIRTSQVAEVNLPDLIRQMIGTTLKDQYVKVKTEIGPPLLRVEKLDRKGVLHDISLRLNRSEILGICGLAGSGRTELVRSIVGIDPRDRGDVFLDGQKVNIKSAADAIMLGIGLIPEDRKEQGVVPCRSVEENISLPLLRQVAPFGVIKRSLLEGVVKDYVSKLDIKTPSPLHLVQNLSGGNQQKVVLAKWLAYNCKILIFDEPTRGIDVRAKREIYRFMNDLVKSGVSIVMVSSELPELVALSDRILVMSEGRIVEELAAEQATQESLLEIMSQRETAIPSIASVPPA
jgi:ABC-type sugar transport system ATPase subunit